MFAREAIGAPSMLMFIRRVVALVRMLPTSCLLRGIGYLSSHRRI